MRLPKSEDGAIPESIIGEFDPRVDPKQDALGVPQQKTARRVGLPAELTHATGQVDAVVGAIIQHAPDPFEILRIAADMRADEAGRGMTFD